jgi:hypothetical protein
VKITFKEGDATNPEIDNDSINILCHCVNDGVDESNCGGVMGAGIALAIRKKWPIVFEEYSKLFDRPARERNTAQGKIQLVKVEQDLWVCNMFCQSGIGGYCHLPAIRYMAVEEAFARLLITISRRKSKLPVILHTCRFGSGLAGASWGKIEEILRRVFAEKDIYIVVYDLPGSSFNP